MNKFAGDLASRLKLFSDKVTDFIPDILVMIIILAAGFLTAYILRYILTRVLRAARFDVWSDSVGLASMMKKGGIQSTPSSFVSLFVYWMVVLIFFMAGFSSLNMRITNELISVFFLYLPRFFSALIIIIVGYMFAGFLGRAALLAGVNSGVRNSKFIGETVKLFVLIFVFAMALEQLSIAPWVVIAAFSILFGGAVLAISLAFGLGGRDAAKDFIEDLKGKKDKDKNDMRQL